MQSTEILEGKKKRVTRSRLLKMVNEALDRLETGFVGTRISKSRFRPQDYEGGAWVWSVELAYKSGTEMKLRTTLYCFLPWSDFQGCVDGTDILTIKRNPHKRGFTVNDYEIWYQKK